MKCTHCNIDCNGVILDNNKFCSSCHCSYLQHINYEVLNEKNKIASEICSNNNNKSTERNIEESIKLSKTFGTVWLPLGIQPSEVDRFLKYFPVNSDIRRSMFMKSDNRCTEIQLQLPLHDRSFERLKFTTEEEAIKRANHFFNSRQTENCDVARIDHLDCSDGNNCSECLESMGFGEVCVMLPKTKKLSSGVWHPHCFKCIKCKHLLVDYLFCWDVKTNSGPYCLRHYDDKYNGRCVSCDEMIFEEKYPSIFDECYHSEHFRCCSCDSKLSDTQFVLESDLSVAERSWKCITCLKKGNEAYCSICKELIEDSDSLITVDGVMAHKNCVLCRICSCKLSLSSPFSYISENNYLYCLICNSERSADICFHCNRSLEDDIDERVTNGVHSWHRHCLVCITCKRDLSDDSEFTIISDPNHISRLIGKSKEEEVKYTICKTCFSNRHVDICQVCNERINKSGVTYNSKLFHESCFKCHHCDNQLSPSMFAFKDDNIFCVSCYSQLFCKCCSCCTKPILGYESMEKMISFENRNWHEKCFMCTNCHKSLIESGFLLDNEKIICIECGVK